jgi:hypothetical protein
MISVVGMESLGTGRSDASSNGSERESRGRNGKPGAHETGFG